MLWLRGEEALVISPFIPFGVSTLLPTQVSVMIRQNSLFCLTQRSTVDGQLPGRGAKWAPLLPLGIGL